MQQKEFIEISEYINDKEYRVSLPLGGKYRTAAEFFGKLANHYMKIAEEQEKKEQIDGSEATQTTE